MCQKNYGENSPMEKKKISKTLIKTKTELFSRQILMRRLSSIKKGWLK